MPKRADHEGTVFANRNKRGPGSAWIGEYKAAGIKVYGATKQEAKKKLDDRLSMLGGVKGPDTVAELLDAFLAAGCPNGRRKKGQRPSAQVMYRNGWLADKLKAAMVGRRSLGTMRPGDVTVVDVEKALHFLYTTAVAERNPKARKPQPLGDDALKKAHDVLRLAFEYARKRDYIPRNIVGDALPPYNPANDDENPRGALTFSDARKLARILERDGEAFFYLLLGVGLRYGEAAALSPDDLSGSTLSVRKNVRRVFDKTGKIGVAISEQMKTPSARRTLVVSADVVRVLKAHMRADADRIRAERAEGRTPLLFAGSGGGIVNDSTARKALAKICRANDVFPVDWDRKPLTDKNGDPRPPTLHELRHTAATLMVAQGKNAVEVADYLGHKDTRVVFMYYRHPDFHTPKTGAADAKWLARK